MPSRHSSQWSGAGTRGIARQLFLGGIEYRLDRHVRVGVEAMADRHEFAAAHHQVKPGIEHGTARIACRRVGPVVEAGLAATPAMEGVSTGALLLNILAERCRSSTRTVWSIRMANRSASSIGKVSPTCGRAPSRASNQARSVRRPMAERPRARTVALRNSRVETA